MMATEEKNKSKSKRKTKVFKTKEIIRGDEESTSSDDIGQKLDQFTRKKQRGVDLTRPKPGLRPKDDLTREIAIGPTKKPSSEEDEEDSVVKDDDSKHFNEELLSQQSMVVNREVEVSDGFGNYGNRTSFHQTAVAPTAVPAAVVVAQLPPLPTKTGLAFYGLDPPTQMARETPSQLTMSQASQLSLITANSPVIRAPSPALIRAPSPSSRAPAPAMSKSAKAQLERDELRRLEHLVLNFSYKNKDRLICQEETEPTGKNGENGEHAGEVLLVARYITVGSKAKNNFQKIDIERFSYKVIRKIAVNFGCKNVSSASKFECRRKMAIRLTSGTVYDLDKVANPVAEAADKKVNTYMRVINACFLPEFYDQFVHLNDAKQRVDYEAASGGNPIKAFWVEISNTVNDTEHKDVAVLHFTGEDDGDMRIKSLLETGGLKLADFNQTTNTTCSQMMKDVTRAHEKIRGAMTRSGTHCVDMWNYLNRTNLQVRVNCIVPGTPVYYYGLLVKTHPGIEGSWNYCLD